MTQVFSSADPAAVRHSAQVLQHGGLVVFPTETVYGLGANGLDPVAVKKVYRAKGRPQDNPVILHIAQKEELSVLAHTTEKASQLTAAFWPGPLTVILKKKPVVPAQAAAGLPTVAVRMPDHAFSLQLIQAAGVPIAAPSANISGGPSPTNFQDVLEDMNGRVEVIIDGGDCRIGVESTVIDMTQHTPVILRPGGVSKEAIETVLGRVELSPGVFEKTSPETTVASPGMKYTHYSPHAQVVLVRSQGKLEEVCAAYQNYCLITFRTDLQAGKKTYVVTSAEELSHILFRAFRECDRSAISTILVEAPEPSGLGLAVLNRLSKAASVVV